VEMCPRMALSALPANRRLAGNAESAILGHISTECGIPPTSIYLCGVEQLEILLKSFPDVAKKANFDPVDSPLIVSPDELAVVVEALARQRQEIFAVINHLPQHVLPTKKRTHSTI